MKDAPVASRRVLVVAETALLVLAIASLALPFIADPPRGLVLAAVKLVMIGFVALRVRRRDAYAMQWSSMGVLLFLAEGVVRATSDPAPSAALGGIAALAAAVYFGAVLVHLRPLKKAARASRS